MFEEACGWTTPFRAVLSYAVDSGVDDGALIHARIRRPFEWGDTTPLDH